MRKAAAIITGVVTATVGLLVGYAPPADALLTYNRCASFFVDRPWPVTNTNITLCWQYTYHAQADGTGNRITNLWVDCEHNCGDIDWITHMTVKAVNPKTGAINDSQSVPEINVPEDFPANRSLSLVGRDVGDETVRWDFDWQYNFTYLNHEQLNDCVSLADPYFGPCDPV